MKTLYVEFLLGHDTGLKESYNRAQEDELLSEYLKAAPELTILEARPERVSEDVEDLKTQVSDLQQRLDKSEKEKAELIPLVKNLLERITKLEESKS